MSKYFLSIFFILLFSISVVFSQSLKISDNGRYLQYENGDPFFYLGDTAWELFHRLNKEEADLYLQNRADKGFTVIQAVVLAELEGLTVPNPYGELPLVDLDPTKPNEKYFEHVDYIVNKAEELGLFIGMLPTWGDKFNKKWGVGPEIFTPDNAEVFGEYVGNRYKDKPIIWILGGDRNCEDQEDFDIIDAMAKGLEKGHNGNQLMTYHPQGGTNSSEWFHDKTWLDFNMFQSGHSHLDDPLDYKFHGINYDLLPIKPTLNGEPCYEDHPVNWLQNGETNWFTDLNTRKAAYWSMFAGACGHTFGNHNIWQMWQQDRYPISWARTNWKEALDYPGALQMKYMKELFESLDWQNLIPDQTIILNENKENKMYQMAMISRNSNLIIAYTPYGIEIAIDATKLKIEKFSAFWFNTRDSKRTVIGEFDNTKSLTFKPLSHGEGSDWVLILK
ncbi:MAG: glycoside hydrolase family 140 protein [Melioribacteraceae bacterium]|nr:glycoside hydrolase family 140 protein [Melioribacteraceae bacterium]